MCVCRSNSEEITSVYPTNLYPVLFRNPKRDQQFSDKLKSAYELLLNGDIDGSDYNTIKSEYEHKIKVLEHNLSDINNQKTFVGIESIVGKVVCYFTQFTTNQQLIQKNRINWVDLPQKSIFEESQYRTAQVGNQVGKLILYYIWISKLQGKKKGQATVKRACPFWLLRLGSNQRPSD